MPRFALTLAACLIGSTALADTAALIVENASPSMLDRLRGTEGIMAAVSPLRDEGVDVLALRGADGAAMRDGLVRFLDTLDADTDGVAVLLSGRFVHSATETYLLPLAAETGTAGDVFLQALPVAPLLAVLGAYPGRALLILAEAGPQPVVADFLRDGAGDIDLPQGVTLIRGAPDTIGRLVRDDLGVPARTLVAVARDAGLGVEGYAPDDLVFLPAASAPGAPVRDTPPRPVPGAAVVDTAAEARLWREASAEDTREAYAMYLSAFPEGPNAAEARDRIADIDADPDRDARRAEEALALNREARAEIQRDLSILDYNTRGIDGIFGPGTRGAISAWQRDNGIEESGFLSGNQIARLDDQAAQRAEELEREAARREEQRAREDRLYWRDTGASGDAEGLRAYLARYPDGDYADLATEQLAEIDAQARAEAEAQDRRAWEQAEAAGTEAAYREYLAAFPNGAFAGEAQRRLVEVDRPSTERQAEAQAQAQEAALNLTPIAKRLAEARLSTFGFEPGPVDGRFDADTRRAIRRYQQSRGLTVTGYFDQVTVVRLLADSIRR
ncbi:peptidoglycan-binding domain-containing protein [Roseivivax sp. CAU 1753]